MLCDGAFFNIARADLTSGDLFRNLAHAIDHFRPAAVIHAHGQRHFRIFFGQFFGGLELLNH